MFGVSQTSDFLNETSDQQKFLNSANLGLEPVNEEVEQSHNPSGKSNSNSGSIKDMDAFLLDRSGGDKPAEQQPRRPTGTFLRPPLKPFKAEKASPDESKVFAEQNKFRKTKDSQLQQQLDYGVSPSVQDEQDLIAIRSRISGFSNKPPAIQAFLLK